MQVVLDNGILQVTLSKPGGIVTGIQYNGIDNLLEFRNKETNRGYWFYSYFFPFHYIFVSFNLKMSILAEVLNVGIFQFVIARSSL